MAESKGKRPFRYPSQLRQDKLRSKTRINIGSAFDRWCQLKNIKGLKTHAEVATFLLDCYEQASSSTPLVHTVIRLPSSATSPIVSESVYDCVDSAERLTEVKDAAVEVSHTTHVNKVTPPSSEVDNVNEITVHLDATSSPDVTSEEEETTNKDCYKDDIPFMYGSPNVPLKEEEMANKDGYKYHSEEDCTPPS
ncbi:uncharacterized protein KZ484_024588 [Pholidichthys leucotaenia]